MPPPREATDGAEVLPRPLPIAVEGVVNPTPHLLLSFPPPQLAVPTPLPTSVGDDRSLSSLLDEEGAAHQHSDSQRWNQETIDALTRGLSESAALLVQSNKFTRFLQEELHREMVPLGCPPSRAPTSSSPAPPSETVTAAGLPSISTAEAAERVSATVTQSIRTMLTNRSPRRTIDAPASLGRASTESWAPAPRTGAGGGGMTLRPRLAQPASLPQRLPAMVKVEAPKVAPSSTTAATTTAATDGVAKSRRPSSPPPPHPLAISAPPRAASVVDATLRDAVREVLVHTEAMLDDVVALQQFSSLLPLYQEPFKGVPAEQLTHFLSLVCTAASAPSGLVTDVKAECDTGETTEGVGRGSGTRKQGPLSAGHRSHPPQPKAEKSQAVEAAEWKAAVRGLCCLTALTHHTFPTEAVPDQLVERLVTVLGSVARRVTRAVARPVAELDSLEEEVRRAAHRPRGGRRGGGEGRGWDHGATTPSVIAAAADAATPTTLMWVELLRLYLQRFSLVVCTRAVNLVSEADLERLEDSIFQCLFLVPHRATTRDVFLTYTSYVMDAAVHAYGCVWNRLEVQRAATMARFFPRVLLSEYLTLRTYSSAEGTGVMPLTVAVLSAAQSLSLYTVSPPQLIDGRAADRLQHQCSEWASAMVEQLLLPHIRKEEEKATRDVAWQLVLQLLEDLVELLGAPEWPAADPLLHACVFTLSKLVLVPSGGQGVTPSPPPPFLQQRPGLAGIDCTQLAVHVVDIVAHIAAKLLDTAATTLTGTEALDRFLAEVQLDSAAVEDWRASTAVKATQERPGGGPKGKKRPRREKGDTDSSGDELLPAGGAPTQSGADEGAAGAGEADDATESASSRMACLVYYALSRNVETTLAVDVSSTWLHARAAHVLCWRRYQQLALPDAALDRLVRATAVPCGGLDVERERLRCWCRALASVEERSMLNAEMHEALISLFLSVFQARDVHGVEMAYADGVIKKALSHLPKLTGRYPPLVRRVWSIARRCVYDENARVRESSVPILLTLLSGLAGHRTPASGLSQDKEQRAQVVVATLLNLLNDKSVGVVTRTIAALDTLLVDKQYRWLLVSDGGEAILSYIQFNLLPLTARGADVKHQTDVTRHFLRRWAVTLMEEDTAPDSVDATTTATTTTPAGGCMLLANELLTLTRRVTERFPYEATADNALVQLLRHMQRMASEAAGEDGACRPHAAATLGLTAASTSTAGRRRQRNAVEVQQLDHAMRSAARALWGLYQSAAATPDKAVACLATLHVLALACRGWVGVLLEQLTSCLSESPKPRFPDPADEAEFVAGTRLQVCLLVGTVLAAPKVPTISLHYLSQQLMRVLSKYVGKLQTRVIAASIRALTAMITSGVTHPLSDEVNVTHLVQCYGAMNSYYVQVTGLLDRLGSDERTLGYAQRYLYLLAEFLRQYPGWRSPKLTPLLLRGPTGNAIGTSGASQTPNLLAKEPGICGNVFDLVERVLAKCPTSAAAPRPLVGICLRVLASLCMLEPTTYLYCCEPHLRAALRAADAGTQVQGLTLIRDFLVEEDARVDLAARLVDRMYGAGGGDAAGARPATGRKRGRGGHSGSEGEGEAAEGSTGSEMGSGDERKERKRGLGTGARKQGGPATSPMGAIADQNSGMSTWLIQRFHSEIVARSLSGNEQVRSLCLDILHTVAQCGLQPPVKYLDVVAALATDVNARIRTKASQLLLSHMERYEDVMAAKMSRAVLLAFDLHHACGVDLVASACTTDDTPQPTNSAAQSVSSVYAPFFSRLHKRNRQNVTVTLTRFFYQDTKASGWCREYGTGTPREDPCSTAESPKQQLGSHNPVTFLAHLAVALGLCPFPESDVPSLLQHCRTAIDLNGQSSLDAVTTLLEVISARTGDSAFTGTPVMELLTLWKCVGVVLVAAVRRRVRAEHHLSSAKPPRGAAGPLSHSRREVRRLAARELVDVATALVCHASPLLRLCPPLSADGAVPAVQRQDPSEWGLLVEGLTYLRAQLEVALAGEGGEGAALRPEPGLSLAAPRLRGRPLGGRTRAVPETGGSRAGPRRRRRRLAVLDSSDGDDSVPSSGASDTAGEGGDDGATANVTTPLGSGSDEGEAATDAETVFSDSAESSADSSDATEDDD